MLCQLNVEACVRVTSEQNKHTVYNCNRSFHFQADFLRMKTTRYALIINNLVSLLLRNADITEVRSLISTLQGEQLQIHC